MTLRVRLDRSGVAAGQTTVRYALVTLQVPPAARKSSRPPADVAFVLDRSGSMAGQKITLARRAVGDALRLLRADDRFALVVYDEQVDVVFGSTLAGREARTAAATRLREIDARGSTDLAGGWLRGADEIAATLGAGRPTRVLLLTDGLANVGLTDSGALAARAAELRARGIDTSTFGVGADFDERLLEQLAVAGGGHFYFIERAEQIADLLTSELGETLDVVVRGAALVFDAPQAIDVAPLGDYPVTMAGRVTRVELGDLVAEQEVTLVVKLAVSAQLADPLQFTLRAVAQDGALGREIHVVTLTPRSPQEVEAEAPDSLVCRALAARVAALARMEALEKNRCGDYEGARHVLRRAADAIVAIAHNDAGVLDLAGALRAEAADYVTDMASLERKRRHFAAQSTLYSRDVEGKARRTPQR